jgi:NAD(P)-dependent dehydrogenase (short-subunit alcohol dehydrogenase family)
MFERELPFFGQWQLNLLFFVFCFWFLFLEIDKKKFDFQSIKVMLLGSLFRRTMSSGRLSDKVAVITGGSSGIGEASCRQFAAEGARVAVVDINGDGAERVAESLRASGREAMAIQCDVTVGSDVESMIGSAEREWGKVNVVFNNAGISHADDDNAERTEESVWDLTMLVNMKGVFLGCKYAIPALRRAGGGSIINTASFVAHLGAATPQIAYTASKGGVLAMTRELAVIHARENIRVNALCPGPLNTELLQKYLDTEEKRQRRLVHVPMGRFGEADEIARATVFLASDDSSFVTGTSFLVDGGITAAYVTPE